VRVVIAGASGFIGTYLVSHFVAEGATVETIGRGGADAVWGDTRAITRLLDGADLLINLAGKSVNCRYTAANRSEIVRSRVETTAELARAITACATPPPLWVNSSTATIYRHAEDRPMTEATGELGDGFSVSVARAWEAALFAPDLPGTRRVALRMAIVLGDGSALAPLIRLAKFGLGGAQLDGRWFSTAESRAAGTFHAEGARNGAQKFSWIHIDDVVRIIHFIQQNASLEGPVNASAPGVTDNAGFMARLRDVLGRPFGFAARRWMLEVGSIALGTETELVLKSRWVVPAKLVDAGYVFEYPELSPALRNVIASRAASRAALRAALRASSRGA
jgi:NAD dependent epimerase/dehydratase family enzyme